jgi:hypothetical protein
MTTQTSNAKIKSTMLGIEDHGGLTYFVDLNWETGGVGFGGYGLGGEFGCQAIQRLLKTVGVDKWEELPGKYVRVEHEGWGFRALKIGHIVEDKWFSLEELSEELKSD